jgi:hypothetical protein
MAHFVADIKEFVPGRQWMKEKKVHWSTSPTVQGRVYYTDGNLTKKVSPIKAKNPKEAVPFAFPADYIVVQEPDLGHEPEPCLEPEPELEVICEPTPSTMVSLANLHQSYAEDILKIKNMARDCSEQRYILPIHPTNYVLQSILDYEGLLSDEEEEIDELYG